ncbi:MAG: LTA synthase family protein [Bacteroidales bacterium]|nr:LTA synthase family protein [Bacteroidales bacterium]
MRRCYYSSHVYLVMLARLLIALLFFSLSRLLFYLFNTQFFGDLNGIDLLEAFLGGMRFDISIVIILSAPFILMNTIPIPARSGKTWQLLALASFYITNVSGFALNMIDTVYFRFTSKRMTADIFSFIDAGEDDMMTLIPRFLIDFKWEFLSWVFLSMIFIWISSRIRLKKKEIKHGIRYYVINTILFLLTAFISIIGIRGGFQLRPFTIINAGEYTAAKNVSLVLNTPFTIVKSWGHIDLEEVSYFTDEETLIATYQPIHHPPTPDSTNSTNVVLIIMESFGTEYIGALNGDGSKGYTPYLDSIINQGFAFKAYANGKQSIEALPAIVAGLPSLSGKPYITSAYGGNEINSMANLLKAKGYNSSFFHGGRNGTMGFEFFVGMAGFDTYYGKDEYGNDDDFDGNWGIYDDAFFDFFKGKLDVTEEPFLAAFFSLSSHHPYMVPEKYQGMFDKGTLDIHESIMYADYSLGRFMRQASHEEWFKNTLFIFTADHTSLSDDIAYQSREGIYAVPIVFYMPGKIDPEISSEIAQHSDILPSMLGFMDYDKPFLSFGNDLFDTTACRFSVSYIDGIYQLIKDGWSLLYDGKDVIGLYALDKPVNSRENEMYSNSDIADELANFLKAIIQQYNHRLINNQLIIRAEDE